ncbi:protein kinase family protein [Desulfocurvus sp. DL9XJH121]
MSESARSIIQAHLPDFPTLRCGSIREDTSQFMDIGYGDVVPLAGRHYLVLKDEMERRFGLEDPKYWVKRCKVLETGERRILKLVFYERFPVRLGGMEIPCHRSPRKESRILELVRGDARFMQGVTELDGAGNEVRILEIVQGRRLDLAVHAVDLDHETYFRERFPELARLYVGACRALAFLHSHDERHGDVRRDHIFVESGSGAWRWIDFDYTFDFRERPFSLDVFGLGHILLYLAGKGDLTRESMAELGLPAGRVADIGAGDGLLLFPHRVANLRKLYPYIPEDFNRVLMHFSQSSNVSYDTVEELLDDLLPCLERMRAS